MQHFIGKGDDSMCEWNIFKEDEQQHKNQPSKPGGSHASQYFAFSSSVKRL